MFITNHVLAGAAIGMALGDGPASAFAAGLASHFVMDACPHWGMATDRPGGREHFMQVARRDGYLGLTSMTLAALAADPAVRLSTICAMAGATVPDLDKPMKHLLGIDPFPQWFNRFHGWIQKESPERLGRELAAGGCLAVVAALLAARSRRPKP